LAAVLLFAATGRSPFGAGVTDTILRRVLDGHADVSGLDSPIAQAFLAALAPRDRIDTETLVEILHNPNKARKLLPLRSDNPTQVLNYEKTRVYEIREPEFFEPPEEFGGVPQGSTEIVNTQNIADRHADEPIADGDIPSFYYDRGYEIQDGDMPRRRYDDDDDDDEVPPWLAPVPKSLWLALLIAIALAVYASAWLGAVSVGYAAVLVVCGTWGILWGELRERRVERGGVNAYDGFGTVMRLPWAVVRAFVFAAINLLGGVAAFIVSLLVLRAFVADVPLVPQEVGGKVPLPHAALIGLSFFVLMLISWFLPLNTRGREGARSFLNALAPGVGYKLFWTIVLLAIIGLGMILVGNMLTIDWFPLPNIGSSIPWLFEG
ncbi:MAG: hypothetical protein IKZ87_06530, partial [Actinomycetaceae bacterium]|nr:hypothetical protein [Actinomycetaceae bacterium]